MGTTTGPSAEVQHKGSPELLSRASRRLSWQDEVVPSSGNQTASVLSEQLVRADNAEKNSNIGSIPSAVGHTSLASKLARKAPFLAAGERPPLPGRKRLSSYTSEPPETLLLMRQWAREEEQHLLNQCADTSEGSEHSAGGEGGSQAAQPAITRAAAGPPAYVHPMAGSETRDTEAASQYSTPRNTPFLQPAKTWGSPPKVGVAVPKVADNQLGRQLGWRLLSEPAEGSPGVSNHPTAGDLIMGRLQKGAAGGFRVEPLPPDVAGQLLQMDAQMTKMRSPVRVPMASNPSGQPRRDGGRGWGEEEGGEEIDIEFDEDQQLKPFYKKTRFWKLVLSLAFILSFMLAGILMEALNAHIRVANVSWWRLLIFISTLIPVWWTGSLFGKIVIWVTESRFFTAENVLYFVYAVRKPLVWVCRAALLLVCWSVIMYDPVFGSRGQPGVPANIQKWYDAYLIILKLLVCLLLVFVAELLKVLFAKMIANKFTRESHVAKMNAALRKERHLLKLVQPRSKLPWQQDKQQQQQQQEEDGGSKAGLQLMAAGGAGADSQKHGAPVPSGRPNLTRWSAPYVTSEAETPSWWRRGLRRGRGGSLPQLDTALASQEGTEGETPVVLSIDVPASPLKPPSRQPSASPQKAAPLGPQSPNTLAAKEAAAGAGANGWGEGVFMRSQSGGTVLRRSSQGSGSARGAVAARQGSAVLRRSVSRTSGPAPPQPAAAPSTIETDSTTGVIRRGPAGIAAKMARVEKHIRKKSLQVTFYDKIGETERKEKVTDQNKAKRVAFFLFYNIKTDFDRPYLVIDDLEGVMPSEKEAQEAFAMLDEDGNGKVTLAECATAVMNIFKEREYLAASLKDTKNIVGRLAFMIGVGLHIVFFFVYLLIMGLDAWKVFIAIVPVLGAVSFALGSSVKQAVDSSVFLFVTHPYDVGDIIVIGGSWYMVEEITLPCTVVVRTSDSAKIWYPNTELMAIPLYNLTVSPNLNEISSYIVNADTPKSLLEDLKAALREYAAANSQDFSGKVNAWYGLASDVDRPNRLKLSIKMEYNYNFLGPRCFQARGALFHFVVNKLAEWKVEVTNVVQPIAVYGPNGHAAPPIGATWGLGATPCQVPAPPPAM